MTILIPGSVYTGPNSPAEVATRWAAKAPERAREAGNQEYLSWATTPIISKTPLTPDQI